MRRSPIKAPGSAGGYLLEQAFESFFSISIDPRAIALKFSCLAPQEVGKIVGTPTGFKPFVFDS